ncbi:cell division cycle-associated protein 3 [Colius striatus]|uniref:cell division cycle-associated protein 3 n=1 Tax=Colius striatus TaxID=57412 RepID=UPI002B1DDF75|nr:cell division cycle-associated protein 3 [Colius striatus]
MGVSGSAPATPCNRHLAHVSDPRSPSAGILRTPIEVVSSPADSPQLGPAEPGPAASEDWDPRSPTPGISRTPMRTTSSDSVEHLVKQLSEAFGIEAAPRQTAPPGTARPAEESAVEEPAWRSSSPAGGPEAAASTVEETERLPSPSAAPALPARLAAHAFPSGSKPVRRKANNKIMASSAGTGRSPLSILQDDNSPSAPASRQGKRHVLGENLGEKEVTADLSRNLKSGNCAWSNLNKENHQCPFVEN